MAEAQIALPEGTDITALKGSVFSQDQQDIPPVFNPAGSAPEPTSTSQPSAPAPVTPAVPAAPLESAKPEPSLIDPVEALKKELGLESWDAARTLKTEYETLKANPPKAEHKFTNDESKKIYEHLVAGNKKEVKAYLEAQELLENVGSMNDEQQIKLYIKMTNPLYTPKLIDAVYARDYTFDEAKFKDSDGNITDPIAFELAQVDVLQKKQTDTAKAKEYFAKYQSKIDLPPIQPIATSQAEIEQQMQQQKAAQEANDAAVKERVSKVTSKDVAFPVKFNDEASKLDVEFSYEPEIEDLEAAKIAVTNWGEMIQQNFLAADGSPLTAKFLQRVSFMLNPEKVITEAIINAVNAERKRFLRDQKNITETGQRQSIVSAPTDVDLLRQQVYGK